MPRPGQPAGWNVYFVDRPGLGRLSSDHATVSEGRASVRCIVPPDLNDSGYDTISAAVFPIPAPLSMSDVIVPGICNSVAGVLAALVGGAISVGGAAALVFAKGRRA